MNTINQTARSLFLVKMVNGEQPLQVKGGRFDGLLYYRVENEGGLVRWVTFYGLAPPEFFSSSSENLKK